MPRTTLRRARRGAYALEFALVLPVFIALIGGVVEYGRYFDQRVTTVGVVRDAVRAGATRDPRKTPDALTFAKATAMSGLVAQDFDEGAEVTARYVGVSPNQRIEVVVGFDYEPLISLVPSPKRVEHGAVMRMAQQP